MSSSKGSKKSNIKRNSNSVEFKLIELLSPIDKSLMSPESFAKYKSFHDSSGPYKYLKFDELCYPERMRLIHEEAKLNITANFKETDLFKVFQSGDLAAIDIADKELCSKIPQLIALRNSLYSPEFRDLIRNITGFVDKRFSILLITLSIFFSPPSLPGIIFIELCVTHIY